MAITETRKNEEFMRLLEPVLPGLERYALLLTRDRDTAKDLVSETVLIALEQFSDLRSHSSFLPYLITISRRLHFKASSSKKADSLEDSLAEFVCAGISPEVSTDITLVLHEIDKLPSLQREALLMFEVIGMSIKDIAKAQSSSLIATKVRLSRARNKVRSALGIDTSKNQSSIISSDIVTV